MKHQLTTFAFILFVGLVNYGQVPDKGYLDSINYEELLVLFNEYDGDTTSQERIARTYLNRARVDNDTIKVARGYDRLARIFGPRQNILFADSLITYTQNWRHITYPALGYILRGFEYGRTKNLKLQYENYKSALNYALINKNISQQVFLYDRLSFLRASWGNVVEAIKLQDQRHGIIKSSDYLNLLKESTRKELHGELENIFREDLITSYETYVFCNIKAKSYYRARRYLDTIKQLIRNFNGIRKDYHINWIIDANIELDFFLGNYELVIQKSDSIINTAELNSFPNFLKNVTFFRGLAEQMNDESELALKYLKISDSIRSVQKDIMIDEYDKLLFEGLMKIYSVKNDFKNQIKYLDKLLFVDSINLSNYKYFEPELINTFETPRLLKSKEEAIASLKQKNTRSKYFNGMMLLMGLFVSSLSIHFYRQKILFKNRFEALMEAEKEAQEIEVVSESVEVKKGRVEISEEIVTKILKSLDHFETEKLYLDPEVNLNDLAKQFRTNSSYLSRVLNFYKEKNFAQYLNGLRVGYAVKELRENRNLRKFTVEAIALECGYKTGASFSRTFFKNTGIYPSYYIARLNGLIPSDPEIEL